MEPPGELRAVRHHPVIVVLAVGELMNAAVHQRIEVRDPSGRGIFAILFPANCCETGKK